MENSSYINRIVIYLKCKCGVGGTYSTKESIFSLIFFLNLKSPNKPPQKKKSEIVISRKISPLPRPTLKNFDFS